MKTPVKDAALTFSVVMGLVSIWSFLESARQSRIHDEKTRLLHSKLDKILVKLKA